MGNEGTPGNPGYIDPNTVFFTAWASYLTGGALDAALDEHVDVTTGPGENVEVWVDEATTPPTLWEMLVALWKAATPWED